MPSVSNWPLHSTQPDGRATASSDPELRIGVQAMMVPIGNLVFRLFGARVVVVAHGERAVGAVRTLTEEDVGQC